MKYVASVIIPLLRQVDAWLERCISSALQQCVRQKSWWCDRDDPTVEPGNLTRLQNQHKNLRMMFRKERPEAFQTLLIPALKAPDRRVGLLLSDDWLDRKRLRLAWKNQADIVSTGNYVYFPDGRVNRAASEYPRWRGFGVCDVRGTGEVFTTFFLFRRETALRVRLDESIGNYPGIDDYGFI